jgi:hypothetical protein
MSEFDFDAAVGYSVAVIEENKSKVKVADDGKQRSFASS